MLPQTRTPEMPANSRSTFALVASEGSGPADPGSPTSRPQRWETVPLSRGAPRTGVRPCVPAAPRASAASSAGVTGVSQGNQRRKCWRHGLCLLSSFSASSTLWFSVFSVGSRSALSPWVCGSRLRPRAAPPGGHVGRALWIPSCPACASGLSSRWGTRTERTFPRGRTRPLERLLSPGLRTCARPRRRRLRPRRRVALATRLDSSLRDFYSRFQ